MSIENRCPRSLATVGIAKRHKPAVCRAGIPALGFYTAGSSASGQRGRTVTPNSGLPPFFIRTIPA
ncbi:hypothetical protein BSQ40_18420 [Serratia fonticola]|nr:hypothetical protein BSQ40_18420 [Serratia fonticola]